MKHEYYELKQMQILPLEAKITMTLKRIDEWYDLFDKIDQQIKELKG